jgi:hypothetical protein
MLHPNQSREMYLDGILGRKVSGAMWAMSPCPKRKQRRIHKLICSKLMNILIFQIDSCNWWKLGAYFPDKQSPNILALLDTILIYLNKQLWYSLTYTVIATQYANKCEDCLLYLPTAKEENLHSFTNDIKKFINNSWGKYKRNECLINVCKSEKDLSWFT